MMRHAGDIILVLLILLLVAVLADPAHAEQEGYRYRVTAPVASDGLPTWTAVAGETVTPTPDPPVSANPVGPVRPLPAPWETPEGPNGRYSRPQMVALLTVAGWPSWAIPEALAITWCESGWLWWAQNPYSSATGLFQVMPLHFGVMAARGLDPWDALDNARYALSLFTGDGYTWAQWSCPPWGWSPEW